MMASRTTETIRLDGDLAASPCREMAMGAIEYARLYTGWRLVSGDSPADAWLTPTVSPLPRMIGRTERSDKFVSVGADAAMVGKIAADHFAERGFHHFGSISMPAVLDTAFRSALPAAANYQALSIDGDIAAFSLPIAIFCSNDADAIVFADRANTVGLRVPQDVAVLGIGDNAVNCELARTPISSIDLNLRQIGFLAARQLDRLLHRRKVPAEFAVAPLGTTLRGSTDILVIDDEDLAAAVHFIRTNAHRPIEIADVLRDIPLHRRALERGFRKHIRRSPAEELRNCRVKIAQRLICQTDLSMTQIASHSGFVLPQQLAAAFKQVIGVTPTVYRDQFKCR